jgi:hypothetical protein
MVIAAIGGGAEPIAAADTGTAAANPGDGTSVATAPGGGTTSSPGGPAGEPLDCIPGYAPADGLCAMCERGTYSADGRECAPCPAGMIAPYDASTACRPCADHSLAAGDQCLVEGLPTCHPGYAPIGDGCAMCRAGQYSPEGDACWPCPDGWIANPGSAACHQCPSGYFGSGSSCAPDPSPCRAGQVVVAAGCAECPKDTFPTAEGCKDCPPGTYTLALGDPICLPCWGGATDPRCDYARSSPQPSSDPDASAAASGDAAAAASDPSLTAAPGDDLASCPFGYEDSPFGCACTGDRYVDGAGECVSCPYETEPSGDVVVLETGAFGFDSCRLACPSGEVCEAAWLNEDGCPAGEFPNAGSCLLCDGGIVADGRCACPVGAVPLVTAFGVFCDLDASQPTCSLDAFAVVTPSEGLSCLWCEPGSICDDGAGSAATE